MSKRADHGARVARAAYVAPLRAYLREHGILDVHVARRLSLLHGRTFSRQRLYNVWTGYNPAPAGFVEDCCRILGRPVEEVMGAEWVATYGNTHPQAKAS